MLRSHWRGVHAGTSGFRPAVYGDARVNVECGEPNGHDLISISIGIWDGC